MSERADKLSAFATSWRERRERVRVKVIRNLTPDSPNAYSATVVRTGVRTGGRFVAIVRHEGNRARLFGTYEAFHGKDLILLNGTPFVDRHKPSTSWWASVHGLERIATMLEACDWETRSDSTKSPRAPRDGWRLLSAEEAREWVRHEKASPKRGAETDTDREAREAHEARRAELRAAKVAALEARVRAWTRKRALAETKVATYTKALARAQGQARTTGARNLLGVSFARGEGHMSYETKTVFTCDRCKATEEVFPALAESWADRPTIDGRDLCPPCARLVRAVLEGGVWLRVHRPDPANPRHCAWCQREIVPGTRADQSPCYGPASLRVVPWDAIGEPK